MEKSRNGFYTLYGFLVALIDLRYRYFHDHVYFTILYSRMFYLYILFYEAISRRGEVISTLHSGTFYEKYKNAARLKKKLFIRTMNRFNGIIVDSEGLARQLSELGIGNGKIIVIPPLLPMEPMGTKPGSALPVQLSTFLDLHPKTLILTGWAFNRIYNFEIAVRVLKALRSEGIPAGLVILNSGVIAEKGYREEILSEIARAGLEDNVVFVTDLPDLFPLYEKASVLLRLTSCDGNPLSVMEAIGYGLPVIASDIVSRPVGTTVVSLNEFDKLYEAVLTTLTTKTAIAGREKIFQEMESNLDAIVSCYSRWFA